MQGAGASFLVNFLCDFIVGASNKLRGLGEAVAQLQGVDLKAQIGGVETVPAIKQDALNLRQMGGGRLCFQKANGAVGAILHGMLAHVWGCHPLKQWLGVGMDPQGAVFYALKQIADEEAVSALPFAAEHHAQAVIQAKGNGDLFHKSLLSRCIALIIPYFRAYGKGVCVFFKIILPIYRICDKIFVFSVILPIYKIFLFGYNIR